jgi:bloom syndrome protein
MQLMFLGEEFDAKNCGKMCDNCRQGLRVIEQDYTTESSKVLEFVRVNSNYKCNVTLKMIVELFKGRKLQKSYIRADIISDFSGQLKHLKDSDLRRLVIKLLALGILEETFVSMKVMNNTNVAVYVTIGRHAKKFEEGRLKVMLSNGVEGAQEKPTEKLALVSQKEALKFKQSDLQNDDANFLLGGGAQNLGQNLDNGSRVYIKNQAQRIDENKFMAPRFDDEEEE